MDTVYNFTLTGGEVLFSAFLFLIFIGCVVFVTYHLSYFQGEVDCLAKGRSDSREKDPPLSGEYKPGSTLRDGKGNWVV